MNREPIAKASRGASGALVARVSVTGLALPRSGLIETLGNFVGRITLETAIFAAVTGGGRALQALHDLTRRGATTRTLGAQSRRRRSLALACVGLFVGGFFLALPALCGGIGRGAGLRQA